MPWCTYHRLTQPGAGIVIAGVGRGRIRLNQGWLGWEGEDLGGNGTYQVSIPFSPAPYTHPLVLHQLKSWHWSTGVQVAYRLTFLW